MDPLMLKLSDPELDEALSRAYLRVEHYLCALRIRNKRVLNELVHAILERIYPLLKADPSLNPEELVMNHVDQHVASWYAKVTEQQEQTFERLATASRMSLFNANLPSRWSGWFLREGPWPEEFVAAMKRADLLAHPQTTQKTTMTPEKLRLGTVGDFADETWKLFGKWPVLGITTVTAAYLLALAFILYFVA